LRVGHFVKDDIVPLMKIQGMKPAFARILLKHGYRHVCDVSKASPSSLETIFVHLGGSCRTLVSNMIQNATTLLIKMSKELQETASTMMPTDSRGGTLKSRNSQLSNVSMFTSSSPSSSIRTVSFRPPKHGKGADSRSETDGSISETQGYESEMDL
jgi:hypothetical protein